MRVAHASSCGESCTCRIGWRYAVAAWFASVSSWFGGRAICSIAGIGGVGGGATAVSLAAGCRRGVVAVTFAGKAWVD
jgi:hypothetical protein